MKSFEEFERDWDRRYEQKRARERMARCRRQIARELRRANRMAYAGLVVILTGVAATVLLAARAAAPVQGTSGEGSYSPEPAMPSTSRTEAITKAEPDINEDELIEAALVEQGYLREDIPLTYEEQDFLHSACEEFGVQYELAVAVVWKETNFRNVMGDNGESYGYMQIQPKWHEDRMAALGVTDLMDPYSNFRVGCHYLAELLEKYDGNVEMALMGYNAGTGGANKYWFSQGVYTNEYSQKVLGYMEGLLNV